MALSPRAARRAALDALVAAEQRVGRLRAELAEAEAEAGVLRRKLRVEVGRQWAHLDDAVHDEGGGGAGAAAANVGGGEDGGAAPAAAVQAAVDDAPAAAAAAAAPPNLVDGGIGGAAPLEPADANGDTYIVDE